MIMFHTQKPRLLAVAALVLAGALIPGTASAQSERRGVFETPPNDPLFHRPRGNWGCCDQNQWSGSGSFNSGQNSGQFQGSGQNQWQNQNQNQWRNQNQWQNQNQNHWQNQGKGQNAGHGRPWNEQNRHAYTGQPGFGYHQPLGPGHRGGSHGNQGGSMRSRPSFTK